MTTAPAGVARLASTIVTMLPSSAEVQDVYLNPTSGILRGLQDHPPHHASSGDSMAATLCIDSTTLDVACASSVASQLKREIAGAEMLDAPVSGGVVGAREGSLTFMCGGTEATFSQAQWVLRAMGKKMIYCGPSGSGLAAKLTNNMLLAVSMMATAEAMHLGQRLGLKADLLAQVINSSTGRCWSSESNNPAPGALLPGRRTPADDGWTGGFACRLMAKDLRLALAAAEASGVSGLRLSSHVKETFAALAADEAFAGKDFSVIYDWLRRN